LVLEQSQSTPRGWTTPACQDGTDQSSNRPTPTTVGVSAANGPVCWNAASPRSRGRCIRRPVTLVPQVPPGLQPGRDRQRIAMIAAGADPVAAHGQVPRGRLDLTIPD